MTTMTTDQKGAIAEAVIVQVATRLGLGVLKPLIAAERYDLVLDLRPGLIRMQCKWAALGGRQWSFGATPAVAAERE